MSRIREMIELTPPAVFREARPERLTVSGFTCPECHGNGWFWSEDGGGDWEKKDCPVCGGTKEVTAEVVIRWRGKCCGNAPTNKTNENNV